MDLDAQRDVYLKLLETEHDPTVCRGYLRRLAEIESRLADARPDQRTVIDADAQVPPTPQPVEIAITTVPPLEDGVELEIIVSPEGEDGVALQIIEQPSPTGTPGAGDWFENVETALYQRSTAGYPVVQQRFRQWLPTNGVRRRSAS